MIQSELQQGNSAGHEHYRRAGEMLIEAKDQIGHGGWGRWLAKNFELSDRQAREYMRWAREHNQNGAPGADLPYRSLREMRGATQRDREERQSKQQQAFRQGATRARCQSWGFLGGFSVRPTVPRQHHGDLKQPRSNSPRNAEYWPSIPNTVFAILKYS
jgi:hypothetical protein